MKTTTIISFIILVTFSLALNEVFAQNKPVVLKEKNPNDNFILVRKKHGIVRRKVQYHPTWAPKISFTNRWVYFPRYNFYWDNYRNVYVYWSGKVWIAKSLAPKETESVDLSLESKVELCEENDKLDSIQIYNENHQNNFIIK